MTVTAAAEVTKRAIEYFMFGKVMDCTVELIVGFERVNVKNWGES